MERLRYGNSGFPGTSTTPVNVWGVGYRLVDGPVGEVAAAATAREMGEAS